MVTITSTNRINSSNVNDLLRMLRQESYCVQTGLAFLFFFKQHSVNKIAFIVLRGQFEAVGSRS